MAVTLQQAKSYLRVDFNTDDALIETLISTAEEWVSKYTNHILNPRTDTLDVGCHEIYDYPLSYTAGDNFKVEKRSLKSIFEVKSGSVSLTVGYTSYADIPKTLITAVLKLVTYLYENRDIYTSDLPFDVQMLINQYRRSIAFA